MLLVLVLVMAALVSSCVGEPPRRYAEPPADSYTARSFQLTVAERTESVRGAEVTPAFFQTANAPPLLGRLLVAEDFRSDSTPVAMLHHELWSRVFKSAPDVIGSSISIDGRPHLIVGIMPRDFNFPAGAQIWTRGTR